MTIEQSNTAFGPLEGNIGILSYFDRFSPRMTDKNIPSFIYDFENPALKSLKATYKLTEVVQEMVVLAECCLALHIPARITNNYGASPF